MEERGSILDLPDDPTTDDQAQSRNWRARRGVLVATLGASTWLAVVIVVARSLALGGYRNHWLVLGALLGGGGAALAWFLVGPGEQRAWWPIAFAVVGLVLVPVAAAGATPSPARLSQITDEVGLPGKAVRESRKGNGLCRPACSELHRVVVTETSSFTKVRTQVSNALKSAGFTVRVYGTSSSEPQRIDAGKDNIRISLAMLRTTLSKTTIEVFVFANGPSGSRQVG